MTQRRITDDLPGLFAILPEEYVSALKSADRSDDLLEIVIDLGRLPMARFIDCEVNISDHEVTKEQIGRIVEKVGKFDADNRAGIERTLHRISAIRNKRDVVIGLTCRVGRAVYGTIDIIEDIVASGKSILLLGRPGIGKTTMLREAARILAEKTRVVIVDTSNEIGGDGDVPHPAVGRARRMQVSLPSLQHEVMIEAVENHNPEVIVIDEIGRELEAAAARTIAERGVQLVATAHGRTLENLLLNPTLSDLIGGIESVTLSDEEARRRGTQKTVLERRAPPTFDVLIEIQERDRLVIHHDVATSVDTMLRGFILEPEIRFRDENGVVHTEKQRTVKQKNQAGPASQGLKRAFPNGAQRMEDKVLSPAEPDLSAPISLKKVSVYPYGVARNRLDQSAKRLGVPVEIVKNIDQADILITLKSYYRDRQKPVLDAEEYGLPIFVLRSNTNSQIEQVLIDLFNLSEAGGQQINLKNVNQLTQEAIEAVRSGQRWVDLPSATSKIRRLQHDLVRDANLISHSYGREPNRHVRVFRE